MEARIGCDILFEKLSPRVWTCTIFIETGLQIWSCVWAGAVMCAGERERVVRNY